MNSSAAAGALPAPASRGRLRAPLHVFIGTLFTALVVLAGAAIGWHNFAQNRALTLAAADDLFSVLARETRAELEAVQNPTELLVDLLARQRLGAAVTFDERMASAPFLVAALSHAPAVSALYAGYDSGEFFLVRRLAATPEDRARFAPPEGAAYLVQSIERTREGAFAGTYAFLDGAARLIARRGVPDYAFDPRTRGWFSDAKAAADAIFTAPYVFFTTREVGITLAQRSELGPAVVGADLTLGDLSRALGRHPLPPSAEIVLFDRDGTALAHRRPGAIVLEAAGGGAPRLAKVSELGIPALATMIARFDPATPRLRDSLDVGGRAWEASVMRLDDPAGRPGRAYLAVLTPTDELLGAAWRITRSSALLTLAIVLACVPVAWLLSRLVSGSLQQLTGEARAVRRFDFGRDIATGSAISEIGELAGTMDAMKRTIRRFLDIAATIAGERSFERLLTRVLRETMTATGSRAGTICLVGDDGVLRPAAALSAPDAVEAAAAAVPTALPEAHPARRALHEGRTIIARLPDAAEERREAFGEAAAALPPEPYAVVAVRLANRQGAPVGALCLFQQAAAGDPSPDLVAFTEALSGTIAVAVENQALLRARKALLDAFIRVVAGAIDAKSRYTGGHCQRVPALARMIAQAACDATTGPFRDFAMTDDQWEALHIAAWLHDCGKVTTPEHVVDKATKLEAICDRLHEIRMRFEVLKRDAEIDCWRRIAAGGDHGARLADLAARHRELDAEFAFVAACNEGGEAIAPEAIERLRRIGARTWQRTLDDRIGLSVEERARKERTPAAVLPATEHLLADKPEHLVEHDGADRMPPDNRWGFRVEAPPHKANLGELHNLSIGRGTLTAEDRYRINDHIVRTIIMLSELPFTGHLRGVPEMAGGHHERMDGGGYPKGLTGAEMSVQARMLAIADVFEALTAADRPYKKAKPLSESIRIMARMRDERHLDPDVFELFLTAGVFRDYAQRFLAPGQIDDVDVAAMAQNCAPSAKIT